MLDVFFVAIFLSGCFLAAFYLRKEQEVEERESMLAVLLEGVIFFDKNMKVKYLNFSAAQMLGVSSKSLINKPLTGNSILVIKSLELLMKAKDKKTPLTDFLTLETGRKSHLALIAVPLRKGAVLVLQDASDQQKILEVGKDFVANASHELKTPITIIRGFTETLQDTPDLPREIVEDILEKIVRNCQRMNSLVKNLLTLADVESLPLTHLQPCDLVELFEECKRSLLAVYPTAKVQLIKEGDAIVEVEAGILELAIFNLLDNAAKYSEAPAEIRIFLRQEEDQLVVSISDQGLGIPQQDVEHIFERFYTVNKAHSRKLGGAGLGLSLVKKIIEKHHGVLTVSSILGKGTTFTFSLPYRHR